MPTKTFDVFDTVITRLWARPRDVFAETARRCEAIARAGISPENWVCLRVKSESDLRLRHPSAEVTLREIFEEVGTRAGLSIEAVADAMETEWQIEFESAVPVPAMARQVERARRMGFKVAFLSDMYLEDDHIRAILSRCGILRDEDAVLVSSKFRGSKHNGRLFQEASRLGRIECHIGDNAHADVAMARQNGIEALLYPDARLTRYEEILAGEGTDCSRVRSLIAGAARRARLSTGPQSEREATLWALGANVVGPVFLGFVLHVLADSLRRGAARVYFVSRDGQLLEAIAKSCISAWGLGLEARYLYGSRAAWHLPAVETVDERVISWVVDRTRFLSLKDVARLVSLPVEVLSDALRRHRGDVPGTEGNLPEEERETLRDVLRRDEELGVAILESARKTRALTLDYLRQEGLFEEMSYTIVDVGWHGRLACSLGRLLRLGGRPKENMPSWCFFALSMRPQADAEPDCPSMDAFLFDCGIPEDRGAIMRCREVYEIFLQATHGGVVGYASNGGRIRPTFASENNQAAMGWGLEHLHGGALAFLRMATETLTWPEVRSLDFRPCVSATLAQLILHPAAQEAECLGSFPFADAPIEGKRIDLAPGWTFTEAATSLFCAGSAAVRSWPEGSEARSSRLCRVILRARRSALVVWARRLLALPVRAARQLFRAFFRCVGLSCRHMNRL